ncbi:MAG: hypothetical protein AAB156_02700 [Pseudomonadota bacterium]
MKYLELCRVIIESGRADGPCSGYSLTTLNGALAPAILAGVISRQIKLLSPSLCGKKAARDMPAMWFLWGSSGSRTLKEKNNLRGVTIQDTALSAMEKADKATTYADTCRLPSVNVRIARNFRRGTGTAQAL